MQFYVFPWASQGVQNKKRKKIVWNTFQAQAVQFIYFYDALEILLRDNILKFEWYVLPTLGQWKLTVLTHVSVPG